MSGYFERITERRKQTYEGNRRAALSCLKQADDLEARGEHAKAQEEREFAAMWAGAKPRFFYWPWEV